MNGARIGGGGGGGRTSWAVFIDINVGLITAARPKDNRIGLENLTLKFSFNYV